MGSMPEEQDEEDLVVAIICNMLQILSVLTKVNGELQ